MSDIHELFRQKGLQSEDRIVAINGTPIKNRMDLRKAIHRLKNEKQMGIEIEREGQRMLFSVLIKE
ncbi:MAG: PDZ domain-containing protein [Chitinivibrionales bacterium]|nr:PDZ domain-containing protein [Chitinivibrionales bacterium]